MHSLMGRIRICITTVMLLACAFDASGLRANEVFLEVANVPAHRLVIAHVDLTEAMKYCGKESINTDRMSAKSISQGLEVPVQFVPEIDWDATNNVRGTLILKLPTAQPDRIELMFGESTPAADSNTDTKPFSGEVATAFYRVVHDASKQGGMPSSIRFSDSGEQFRDFRWNDRLYSRDLGSYSVSNDRGASVNQVSHGALASVIRTRAEYLPASAVPHPSTPSVVYDWYYFHDLPLVYVVASASQSKADRWDETHFLELNFPHDDFANWAGGSPETKGVLEPETRSIFFSQWAAIHDTQHAIGMLGCGRISLYDHDGGNYLQSHTDQAWEPWESPHLRRSAWLWIGATEQVAETLQDTNRNLPSMADTAIIVEPLNSQIAAVEKLVPRAMPHPNSERSSPWWRLSAAKQLAKQRRFDEANKAMDGSLPSDSLTLMAGELGVIFERFEQGVGLLSISDTATHTELLSPKSLPLFEVTLQNRDTQELRHIAADAQWQTVTMAESETTGQYELHWTRPLDSDLSGLEVTAQVTAEHLTHALDWQLSVQIDNPSWSLWHVKFPQVAIDHFDSMGELFVPEAAGRVESNAWRGSVDFGGRYPSGWITMPYFAAYAGDQSTGLYVGYHDRFAATKELKAATRPDQRDVLLSFDCPVSDMGGQDAKFSIDGHVRMELLRGNWFEAATIYRDWVRQHAAWYPDLGVNGREDTPKWMRELSIWTMGGGDPKSGLPILQEFAEKMQLPVGFHWYNWHAIPFDNDYPHYFPADDGFAEAVKLLQQKDIFVMPYINGRLWDSHDRDSEDAEFSSKALPSTTKDEQGQPYLETYGSKEADGSPVELAVMCPSTSLWQQTMRETVMTLMNQYEVRGVYIDQIAAAKPELCFDHDHAHPVGGGHWWTQAYWEMLAQIRREMPAGRILTTECNADPYIKSFDGYLTWHWQHDGQVAAFPAVYGGAIQMFGRAYRQGPSKDLALRMKAAQQLVFGEQIGWIDPSVVREPANFEFLKKIVHLRHRVRRYFFAGEMAKPLALQGDIPQVTADWQWSGQWLVTTPGVMSGVWRLPAENRLVILLANITDQPIKIRFPLPIELQRPSDQQQPNENQSTTEVPLIAQVITPFDPPTPRELVHGEFAQVTLDPQSAQAWQIQVETGSGAD